MIKDREAPHGTCIQSFVSLDSRNIFQGSFLFSCGSAMEILFLSGSPGTLRGLTKRRRAITAALKITTIPPSNTIGQ
jgi:hypothetical protein